MKKTSYSTSEARKILSDLVNQIKYQNKEFIISRHGKMEAMLVPIRKNNLETAEKENSNFDKHVRNIRAEKNKIVKYSSKDLKYEYAKIAKKYNLDLIVLFGSHSSGKVKPDSDVDIAVRGKNGLTFAQENNIYRDLVNLFGRDDIDVINLNRIHDVLLRYEIFFEGKLILEKTKNIFSYLKSLAFFDYHDFMPYFKIQDRLTKKRINNLVKSTQ